MARALKTMKTGINSALVALLLVTQTACRDDDTGVNGADDAGPNPDAAVACVLAEGRCTAGCDALEARGADPMDPEPCFGEFETLACIPRCPDGPPCRVPREECVRSKDGHWLAIASRSLTDELLKTGDYVLCTDAEALRLREYSLCEQ
jgi:hypothetical protein